jgi:hypothetical protein
MNNYADLKEKLACLRDVVAWYCGIPSRFKESERDFAMVVELFETVRAMVDYQQPEQQQLEYQQLEYQQLEYQQLEYQQPEYQQLEYQQPEYQQLEYQPELQQPARKRIRSASFDEEEGGSGSFITLDERKMSGEMLRMLVPYVRTALKVPRGIAVDHTQFPQGLFAEIVEYII